MTTAASQMDASITEAKKLIAEIEAKVNAYSGVDADWSKAGSIGYAVELLKELNVFLGTK